MLMRRHLKAFLDALTHQGDEDPRCIWFSAADVNKSAVLERRVTLKFLCNPLTNPTVTS
jgi:hypothetical protein